MLFTKMHGLGNDFVVLDALKQPLQLSTELMRFLGDRRYGVGCDQILLLEPNVQTHGPRIRYRIFNGSDGTEVEHCGNGARCVALYLWKNGYAEHRTFEVATQKQILTLQLLPDERVRVAMGVPEFDLQKIPCLVPPQQAVLNKAGWYRFQDTNALQGFNGEFFPVSMGNPHAVFLGVAREKITNLGPLIERHPYFPQRVNVSFAQLRNRKQIELAVWERAAGATLACGSAACATAVAAIGLGLAEQVVEVQLPGGALQIEWSGSLLTAVDSPAMVYMTGPAQIVFTGEVADTFSANV